MTFMTEKYHLWSLTRLGGLVFINFIIVISSDVITKVVNVEFIVSINYSLSCGVPKYKNKRNLRSIIFFEYPISIINWRHKSVILFLFPTCICIRTRVRVDHTIHIHWKIIRNCSFGSQNYSRAPSCKVLCRWVIWDSNKIPFHVNFGDIIISYMLIKKKYYPSILAFQSRGGRWYLMLQHSTSTNAAYTVAYLQAKISQWFAACSYYSVASNVFL